MWWNTFYNLGGEIVIAKVAPFYEVSYIPTEPSDMGYLKPDKQSIKYIPKTRVIKITYLAKEKVEVSYIKPKKPGIKYVPGKENIKIT